MCRSRRADRDHRLTDPEVGTQVQVGRRQVAAGGAEHGDVVALVAAHHLADEVGLDRCPATAPSTEALG
jgi:hypothetical protein